MPGDADFSINDLARLTGLNVRTIRYWIAQGLIPASGESGPGAHYGQGHLDRLRLIKRLQAEYLPNAQIRRRLAPLSDADVAGLVAEPSAGVDAARPATSALEYVRGLLGQAGARGFVAAPIAQAVRVAPPASASLPPAAIGTSEMKVPHAMPVGASPVASAEGVAASGDGVAGPAEGMAAAEGGAPAAPERSQWERLSLGPNIELHIRRPLSRPEQRRVERLITIARQVLREGGER